MCQIKYLYDISPVRFGCLLRVIFAEWSQKIHWPFVIDFVEFIPFENVRTMFVCVSSTLTKFVFLFANFSQKIWFSFQLKRQNFIWEKNRAIRFWFEENIGMMPFYSIPFHNFILFVAICIEHWASDSNSIRHKKEVLILINLMNFYWYYQSVWCHIWCIAYHFW